MAADTVEASATTLGTFLILVLFSAGRPQKAVASNLGPFVTPGPHTAPPEPEDGISKRN